MAAVAVVAAMLFGPSVPGASSAALLSWRNQDHNGPASRSTVSPFVTIRNRLVNQSGTIVFSVQSPQKAYWRLTSLDNFDGDIWSSNDSYRPVDSGRLPRDNGEALSAASVRQAYTINTLDSIWLPAAFQPTRIGNLDNVSYNTDSGSLISASDTTNGETYTVTSALPQLTGSELGSAPAVDPNASSLKKYVQLPAIPKTVRDLAARVVAGHPTEYDKALAIQNYLRAAPFSYNLNVPAGHSGNALERFLFVTHQGYCEQFAGSYAVMARAVGLPARVAVGFTPGEYDPSTGTYTVRDEHAHAWPEIYFPSTGWVAFEPTPGRGAPNATSYTGVPEAQAGQPANSTTQPTTAPSTTPTTVSPGGSSNTTIPKDEVLKDGTQRQTHHTSVFERLLWILLGLLGVAAIWAVGVPSLRAWLRHRRRVAGEAVGPDGRVLVAWEEANDTLANVGAGRLASETLDEHARRAAVVAKLDADSKAALAALAGDAVAASYSGLPASSDDATRAVAAAHAVEQAVHSSASRPDRIKWALDPRPLVRNRFVARSERQRARTDQKTPV